MSNHTQIINLIKAISGQANVLTIPRLFVTLTNGNHRAALILSQCIYWSDRGHNPDGWFYKTFAEWKTETGIPRGGIENAIKAIAKWVETDVRKVGNTPKNHYRVNLDALAADISEMLDSSKSEVLDSDTSEVLDNSTSYIAKITTKITSADAQNPISLNEWFGDKPSTPSEPPKTNPQPLIRGIEQNQAITVALQTLTGRMIDPNNKTSSRYITDLRAMGANPDQCRHFGHYWQVVEEFRGPHSKPSLKDVWERWQTAMAWRPIIQPAMSKAEQIARARSKALYAAKP